MATRLRSFCPKPQNLKLPYVTPSYLTTGGERLFLTLRGQKNIYHNARASFLRSNNTIIIVFYSELKYYFYLQQDMITSI